MQPREHSFSQHITDSGILIVDDNEVNQLFLKRMLEARGFTKLHVVASAEQALACMADFRPDLVLLDIIMPGGMNGYECCAAMRALPNGKNLPILMQTSITEPELRVKAFENGATDFVSKPVYPDELYARVKVHLENRHALNKLQQYKNRVAVELESARQLQLAILPTLAELEEVGRRCHLSIAAYFQPSSEIGGDFWGMKTLFPQQTAFWLVDFSGHGVVGALNAFRLQAYLKEHSALSARPGEYLSHLNDRLLSLLMRGQFATMFYAIVDTQTNTLFYATACTPHPLVLRKETGKAERIDGSGSLLGIGMHLYPTQSAPFHEGDVLMFYSDALVETPNHEGKYLTDEQLMAVLETYPYASVNDLKAHVLDLFVQHAGPDALIDDITLVICKRTIS